MADDPIVAEVRRAREQLFARFGYDLDRYLAYLSERERNHPERVVSVGEWRKKRIMDAAAPAGRRVSG